MRGSENIFITAEAHHSVRGARRPAMMAGRRLSTVGEFLRAEVFLVSGGLD